MIFMIICVRLHSLQVALGDHVETAHEGYVFKCHFILRLNSSQLDT